MTKGSPIQINRLVTDSDEGRHVASSIFEFKMSEQKRILILLYYIELMLNQEQWKML